MLSSCEDALVRVGSFLELGMLSLLSAMLKTSPMSRPPPDEVGIGSMEDKGVEVYGCFSPHVGDSSLSLSVEG
jgi:hypothetical protein